MYLDTKIRGYGVLRLPRQILFALELELAPSTATTRHCHRSLMSSLETLNIHKHKIKEINRTNFIFNSLFESLCYVSKLFILHELFYVRLPQQVPLRIFFVTCINTFN